jgi:hypothetical protein
MSGTASSIFAAIVSSNALLMLIRREGSDATWIAGPVRSNQSDETTGV